MTGPASQSLWQNATFRRVWFAETAPLAGTAISALAIPLVAVLTLHASAFTVGLLGAVIYVPFLVLGIPLGSLIDHWPRRPVLITADAMRLCAWASIPIASAADALSIAQLIAVQAVVGVATVVSDIAGQAILPAILSEDQLVDGNAKLAVGETACDVAGPLICGALINALSAPAVLAGSAVSAATSAALLSRLKIDEQIDTGERVSATRSIRFGFRLTFGDHVLRRFAAWAAIYNGSQGIVTAVLLLYMTRDLHLSATAIGLLFSLGSGAALVGAFTVNRISRRLGLGRSIVGAATVAALAYLALPLAPAQGAPAAAFVALALVFDDGASAIAVVLVTSVRVALIEPSVMGRVMASARFLTMGAIPFGALLGGLLGDVIGYRATLAVGAGTMCVSIPVIASRRIGGMRELPQRRVGTAAPRRGDGTPVPA